ncbi:MAG: iron-sulfur cluster carrier protein ApbC [Gammaproteobacteria bacterium]|nr:iron-sulfur cluster carrier protein ApbC [Gammaproteobacteria bacterium]MCW8973797.1 iron-sulfur cluster carrier protein ApbC [Gammaproteobacteria bacterium]MCW8991616.1 iron-sulfur cluster carrier protein ApbC [Gammaproteobacteria bacterium]
MSDELKAKIEEALKGYVDPYLEKDLVSAGCVSVAVEGDKAKMDVALGFPAAGYIDELKAKLKAIAEGVEGVSSAEVTVSTTIVSHSAQKGVKHIKGVKNIIAVASGKGGVGKSTTSVNLALALAAEGATVGILDADIYGPSQPRMMGLSNRKPDSPDGKSLEPIVNYGVQSMSIGYLIDEDTPMIWRGPMVTQALEQLLNDTQWREVDYLVIDLPPGTGDTQLTLAQKVPVSGAVIVTTPQDIALMDARKAYKMFEKVEVPVLGVVENMSIHICSKCGHEEHIFGEGGGQKMADDYGVKFLGALPLDISIREEVDAGKPTVVAQPDSRITQIYRDIARRTAAKLSLKAKDYSAKFPKIVISND